MAKRNEIKISDKCVVIILDDVDTEGLVQEMLERTDI